MNGVSNNPLDRFNWDGTPINPTPQQPTPQQPTPQQQATQTAVQTTFTQLRAPAREPSDDEMSLGSRGASPFEEESKEDESDIGALIDQFEQTYIQETKKDPSAQGIKKATTAHFKTLTDAAKNGATEEVMKAIVRYSPVPLTTQILTDAINEAQRSGHLKLVCEAYVEVLAEFSAAGIAAGVIPILSALKHQAISADLQEEAIYHAICAGVFGQEDGAADTLTPILNSLDGFSLTILDEALKGAIETVQEDPSTTEEQLDALDSFAIIVSDKLNGEPNHKRHRAGPKP